MLNSPAWNALSVRQRGLYIEFKRRYIEKKANGQIIESNAEKIHFTSQEATKPGKNGEPPLYGSEHTFLSDIDALIDKGFICVMETGFFEKKATIYGFSDRWKQFEFGKPLNIPIHEKRIQRKQTSPHMANI